MRCREKNISSMRASQNPGMEANTRATTTRIWSRVEYCRTAERMPSDTPMRAESAMDISASRRVLGKRAIMSFTTG